MPRKIGFPFVAKEGHYVIDNFSIFLNLVFMSGFIIKIFI